MTNKVIISGDYNAFNEGFNGAGVYMASGLFQSETFERPIYVGSAANLKRRIQGRHLYSLSKPSWVVGKMHTNKPLFCAWKKHGPNAFVWLLLKSCKPEECLTYEQAFLDELQPFCDEMKGYNIGRHVEAPSLGRKHSKETKAKLSAIRAGTKQSSATVAKKSKAYRLLSPTGDIVEGKNLRAFARSVGLNHQGFRGILTKRYKQYKGWRIAPDV